MSDNSYPPDIVNTISSASISGGFQKMHTMSSKKGCGCEYEAKIIRTIYIPKYYSLGAKLIGASKYYIRYN
jgi:hypothetical protein